MAVEAVAAGAAKEGASLIGSILGPILGSTIGEWLSSGDREKAEQLLLEASAQFNIPLPQLKEMVAEHLGPSAFEDVKADPTLRNAQLSAIDAFQKTATAGGLDPMAQAQQAEALQHARQQEQGQRQAITSGYRRRGMGGSGMDLAAQMGSASQQADRAGMESLQSAAGAQQRAIDAWAKSAGVAGQTRGQDFTENSALAEARDAIGRYNQQTRERVHGYNNDLLQRGHENRVGIADRKYDAKRGEAGYYGKRANDTRAMWGGVGQAAGQAAGAYGDYERRKKGGG